IERIQSGEEIELSAFTSGVDPITREIIEYGGLFEYNVARLQGKVVLPPVHSQLVAGGLAPDLGDPAAVRDARGSGEDGPGAPSFSAENAAAQLDATSRPPGEPVRNRPQHDAAAHADARRPMTIAEKSFASRWVVDAAQKKLGVPWVQAGDSGFVQTDLRFSHEYVSPMAAIFFEQKLGTDARVTDPSSILMFRDHLTYLHEVMPPERVQLG